MVTVLAGLWYAPLASLEVGEHLYWHLGKLKIHGQVFITSWVVMALLIGAAWLGTRKAQRVPQGWQNFMEYVLDFVRTLTRDQLGEKEYRAWLPFVGTLFLFILTCNWTGILLPWKLIELPAGELAASTNDINTTAALALLTSLAYFYAGFSRKGLLGYFKGYLYPSPIMLPFKIIEDFTKPLSLSFRLFGNILADELVVGVLAFLVPVLLPVPMMVLGLFLSGIQALIFATLASTYIAEALEDHEHGEQEAEMA